MVGDPLGLESRRRMYELVAGTPGLHLRDVARRLGVDVRTADYHVRQLAKHGLGMLEFVIDKSKKREVNRPGRNPEGRPILCFDELNVRRRGAQSLARLLEHLMLGIDRDRPAGLCRKPYGEETRATAEVQDGVRSPHTEALHDRFRGVFAPPPATRERERQPRRESGMLVSSPTHADSIR